MTGGQVDNKSISLSLSVSLSVSLCIVLLNTSSIPFMIFSLHCFAFEKQSDAKYTHSAL